MNWLIFGAGAIGSYIGCSLAHRGDPVTFLEQPSVAAEIRRSGLHLHLGQETLHITEPHIAESLESALDYATFDAAIFALKSFDTQNAIKQMTPFSQALPPLICLQNGVENETGLAFILGTQQVIAGTVTSAIGRRAVGEIVLERRRGLGLADTHPRSHEFVQAFNAAGLNATLYSHPADMKWSKMLTNLFANATSAILDLTPAQVIAHSGLFRIELRQLREALAVMAAQKIGVINLPGVPVRLLAFTIRWLPHETARLLVRRSVGRGRGAKMPSFHLDLHSGRGQSEVDFLNGAVVRFGRTHAVPTSVNQLLNETLLGLTSGRLPLDTFAHRPEALLNLLPD